MIRTKQMNASDSRSRRKSDIFGLLLFFIGVVSFLALTWPQNGVIPPFIDYSLRLVAGTGAYLPPIIAMYVGAMFLIGYDRLSFTHSTLGSILLFFTYVIWRHITTPVALHDVSFDTNHFLPAGGIIGAVFGVIFYRLFGLITSYVILIFMACISVVLLVDKPFIELLAYLRKPADIGVNAVKKRIGGGEVSLRRKNPDSNPLIAPEETAASPLAPQNDKESKPKRIRLFPKLSGKSVPDDGTQLTLPLQDPYHATSEKESDTDIVLSSERSKAAANSHDHSTGSDSFELPPISLLKDPVQPPKRSQQELADKIRILEQTLDQFNIGSNVVEIAHGPTITRYEIQLAPGIKVSKIASLADNLAMALAAINVRVEAPIPGKSAIGVEVPNATPSIVTLKECLESPELKKASKLTFALGKDVAGATRFADLTKMPHLLIGGSTNSGKSVCLNVLIATMLFRATPDEVQLIMIDPKRVELSLWDGIPHLMHPVVKDVKQAAGIFRAALKEMDHRYDLFARIGTRNIDGYNSKVDTEERLPYLVIVVDELADLMMQAAAEIETSICRLAQLARATGIHLVIATQRPSVDVITGLIKANISSRIAFAVSSQVDSRTILDQTGAERLIGRGDMLFMPIDAMKPIRMQGCFLSEQETNDLVKYLKERKTSSNYTLTPVDVGASSGGFSNDPDGEEDDEFFEAAVKLVVLNGQASTSMLQRRFKIGYTRAARLIDNMQDRGIVGPPDGAKPREILISRDEVDRMFDDNPFK